MKRERADVKVKMEEIEKREERGNKKRGGSESREVKVEGEKKEIGEEGKRKEKGHEEGKGKGGLK